MCSIESLALPIVLLFLLPLAALAQSPNQLAIVSTETDFGIGRIYISGRNFGIWVTNQGSTVEREGRRDSGAGRRDEDCQQAVANSKHDQIESAGFPPVKDWHFRFSVSSPKYHSCPRTFAEGRASR